MDAVHLYKESIRDDILYLAELKKQNGSERNILNKWFQDSIKNYFLETYASPFLKNQLGDGVIKNVKAAIENKLEISEGQNQLKFMKLVNQYRIELNLHQQTCQFINSLVNILIHQSNFERGTTLWAKQTKKKFVALLLIVLFEQTSTTGLTSFYDIWNKIFPSSTQVKKKLSRNDKQRLRENSSLSFYMPTASQLRPQQSAAAAAQQLLKQQQQQFEAELLKAQQRSRLQQQKYPSSLLPSKQSCNSSTLSQSSSSSFSSSKRGCISQVDSFSSSSRTCDFQEIDNPNAFYQITKKKVHIENQPNSSLSLSLNSSPSTQPICIPKSLQPEIQSPNQPLTSMQSNLQENSQKPTQQQQQLPQQISLQKQQQDSQKHEQLQQSQLFLHPTLAANNSLINTPVLFRRMGHVLPELKLTETVLQSKSDLIPTSTSLDADQTTQSTYKLPQLLKPIREITSAWSQSTLPAFNQAADSNQLPSSSFKFLNQSQLLTQQQSISESSAYIQYLNQNEEICNFHEEHLQQSFERPQFEWSDKNQIDNAYSFNYELPGWHFLNQTITSIDDQQAYQ